MATGVIELHSAFPQHPALPLLMITASPLHSEGFRTARGRVGKLASCQQINGFISSLQCILTTTPQKLCTLQHPSDDWKTDNLFPFSLPMMGLNAGVNSHAGRLVLGSPYIASYLKLGVSFP